MKLLLQRSISSEVDGPFWIETARVEDRRLRGFLILEQGAASYFEPRFDPDAEVFYLSDKGPKVRLYQHNEPGSLTRNETFKFAFSASGQLVSLQCENDEAPYGVALEDSPPQVLDSSATHVGFVPGSETLVVTTLDALYIDGRPTWPLPARRFTLSPSGVIYAHDNTLCERTLGSREEKKLCGVPSGTLDYPCWTPEGVFVSEEAPGLNRLWHVHEGVCVKIWEGSDERLYVCDYYVPQ